MLLKKNRLNRREIEDLKKNNEGIVQGDFFGLLYKKQEIAQKESRFGLIISNTVCNKAVDRNRIKRLLFIGIQENWFLVPGKFLFLAKKKCVNLDLTLLKSELQKFNNRIK